MTFKNIPSKIPDTVSSTEEGYLDGVTSNIQTQLDSKISAASPTFTGTVTASALTAVDGLDLSSTGGGAYIDLTVGSSVLEISSDGAHIIGGDLYIGNNSNRTIFFSGGTGGIGNSGGSAPNYLYLNNITASLPIMADANKKLVSVSYANLFSNITAIPGTTTNNAAAAGFVGEFIQGRVTSFTNIPGSSAAWADATSISLTAGDWDVSALLVMSLNGSVMTGFDVGISSTSGDFATGLQEGDNWTESAALPVGTVHQGVDIPPYRVSIASTTIIYLKLRVGYSVATPQYTCRLSARRIR